MIILIRVVLLYITIMLGSLFLADKFNKKMGECIGINILFIIIFLYILGLFNLLFIATYIVIILEIILGLYVIVKNIKEIDKLKKKVSSIGTVVFTFAFFILAIISINKELSNWDQFSYWSYATKNMYLSNSLIINPSIGIQYPPAQTILQYFFMKVIGVYLQGIEAFSMQILGISLLLPLLENEKRKKLAKLAITIIMFCLLAIFPNLIFYESSYPDSLLGLLIGYMLLSLFKEEKDLFTILKILLALSVLTLTKPTGILISIILIVIMAIYSFLIVKILKETNLKQSKNIKIIIASILIIFTIFTSWTVYKNINKLENINIQIQSAKENPIKVTLNSLLTTVFGIQEETYNEAISNQTLIKKMNETTAIYSPIQISIMGVITILIVISIYFISKLEKEKRKNAIIIFSCVLIGLILYILMLQVAYITMFNEKEMLRHDGIDRYLPTYLIGAIYILITYIIDYFDKKQKETIIYVLLAVIVIGFTNLQSLQNITITAGIFNLKESKICNNGKYYASKIENVTPNNAKIYIVCENQNKKLYQYMIRYYMYPTLVGMCDSELISDNKINIALEEWVKNLKDKNYEYVYILDSNEEFYNYANSIFENNKIEKEKVYKIKQNKESIILIPVDS